MKNPLHNMTIRGRMLVILVLFMIPICILAYQLNAKLEESIKFSSLEVKGSKFIQPLMSLLNEIPKHEIARAQKEAGLTTDSSVLQTATAVDENIGRLVELDKEIGDDLDFNEAGFLKHKQRDISVENLRKNWDAIKSAPAYNVAAYSAILTDIAAMIKHAGDSSNLILDGDLDTYYIVDANFNVFVALLQAIADAKIIGFKSLYTNSGVLDANAAERLRMIADSMALYHSPHLHDSLTTALNVDANFHGVNPDLQSEIPKRLANYEASAKASIDMLRSLARGSSLDQAQYLQLLDTQDNSATELAIFSIVEMEKMIALRVEALEMLRFEVMGVVAAMIIAAFVLFLVISGTISGPIKRMTDTMKSLADGDTAVEVPSTDSKGEIGSMAKAVLVFKENIQQTERMRTEQEELKIRTEKEKRQSLNSMADNFESSVKTVVTDVSASAEQMRSNAERLNALADETKSTSGVVATAATEAAQTATQVAAAAEELTAAIGEISAQVQKSSSVANQASQQAESINQSMRLLVEKSNRVGEVIQFITSIASQINLLALNATIESARAGEAGRGFAVVASEVKNLANQTAKATEEIVQQVQSMQEATEGAVHSVGEIITIIGEISASTAGVAAAVEEQSAATNEISRNIAHTASGTHEIQRSIASVEKGADETGTSSRQVLDSAKALSSQSTTLREKVDEFLRTVRTV